MKRLSNWLSLLVVALLIFSGKIALADAPSVIRVAYPGVGIGNRPAVSGIQSGRDPNSLDLLARRRPRRE
jgi:hypothetical protein